MLTIAERKRKFEEYLIKIRNNQYEDFFGKHQNAKPEFKKCNQPEEKPVYPLHPIGDEWNDPNYTMTNYKTMICPNLKNCRPAGCPFYHYHGDRRRPPADFKYFANSCPRVRKEHGTHVEWVDPVECCFGEKCILCHSIQELIYHPIVYKTVMCSRIKTTGSCFHGVLCSYAHSYEEVESLVREPLLHQSPDNGKDKRGQYKSREFYGQAPRIEHWKKVVAQPVDTHISLLPCWNRASPSVDENALPLVLDAENFPALGTEPEPVKKPLRNLSSMCSPQVNNKAIVKIDETRESHMEEFPLLTQESSLKIKEIPVKQNFEEFPPLVQESEQKVKNIPIKENFEEFLSRIQESKANEVSERKIVNDKNIQNDDISSKIQEILDSPPYGSKYDFKYNRDAEIYIPNEYANKPFDVDEVYKRFELEIFGPNGNQELNPPLGSLDQPNSAFDPVVGPVSSPTTSAQNFLKPTSSEISSTSAAQYLERSSLAFPSYSTQDFGKTSSTPSNSVQWLERVSVPSSSPHDFEKTSSTLSTLTQCFDMSSLTLPSISPQDLEKIESTLVRGLKKNSPPNPSASPRGDFEKTSATTRSSASPRGDFEKTSSVDPPTSTPISVKSFENTSLSTPSLCFGPSLTFPSSSSQSFGRISSIPSISLQSLGSSFPACSSTLADFITSTPTRVAEKPTTIVSSTPALSLEQAASSISSDSAQVIDKPPPATPATSSASASIPVVISPPAVTPPILTFGKKKIISKTEKLLNPFDLTEINFRIVGVLQSYLNKKYAYSKPPPNMPTRAQAPTPARSEPDEVPPPPHVEGEHEKELIEEPPSTKSDEGKPEEIPKLVPLDDLLTSIKLSLSQTLPTSYGTKAKEESSAIKKPSPPPVMWKRIPKISPVKTIKPSGRKRVPKSSTTSSAAEAEPKKEVPPSVEKPKVVHSFLSDDEDEAAERHKPLVFNFPKPDTPAFNELCKDMVSKARGEDPWKKDDKNKKKMPSPFSNFSANIERDILSDSDKDEDEDVFDQEPQNESGHFKPTRASALCYTGLSKLNSRVSKLKLSMLKQGIEGKGVKVRAILDRIKMLENATKAYKDETHTHYPCVMCRNGRRVAMVKPCSHVLVCPYCIKYMVGLLCPICSIKITSIEFTKDTVYQHQPPFDHQLSKSPFMNL